MDEQKKKKLKKAWKIAGVGALTLLGTCTFTGCTDINLNQEQVDKLMYVVDNADTFMGEVVDLMTKQNQLLDRQEAFNKIQLAKTKLYTNDENVWDNLKITDKISSLSFDNYTDVYKWYKTTSGEKVYSYQDSVELCTVVYADNDNFYDYSPAYASVTENENQFYHYLVKNRYIPNIVDQYTGQVDLTADDIADVQMDADGNYSISILKWITVEEENEYITTAWICKYQIDVNCRLTKVDISAGIVDYTSGTVDEDDDCSPMVAEIKIEYGVLTDADVEDDITTAKNACNNQ